MAVAIFMIVFGLLYPFWPLAQGIPSQPRAPAVPEDPPQVLTEEDARTIVRSAIMQAVVRRVMTQVEEDQDPGPTGFAQDRNQMHERLQAAKWEGTLVVENPDGASSIACPV